MKRLVVILLLAIPFLQLPAQSLRVTPTRIDKQEGNDIVQLITCSFKHNTHRALPSDPTALLDKKIKESSPVSPQEQKPSLEVTMERTRKEFDAAEQGTQYFGSIKNVSAETVKLNFYRYQTLPDSTWSSTVCLDVCYSPSTDSLPPTSLASIEPGKTLPFIFHAYVLADNSSDSLVAHIRLEATNTFPGDTVGYTFIARSIPSASVHDEQASVSSTKIVSLYPSPLVNGSAIKVTLQSPRETSFTYSIFDAFGRQVAFGSPSHRLSAGSNTLEIKSLDGLASGSYMLKINFAGGGSDGRVFQVIN